MYSGVIADISHESKEKFIYFYYMCVCIQFLTLNIRKND